jgi:hypothetical protein
MDETCGYQDKFILYIKIPLSQDESIAPGDETLFHSFLPRLIANMVIHSHPNA